MNEKELREKYPPRKVGSQAEFDLIMCDMKETQSKLNHPINDRKMQICKQRDLLNIQKQAINQQLSALSAEQHDIEMQQKGINRLFHELKHELILANPRD